MERLTKGQIWAKILALRNEGTLYDLTDKKLNGVFVGSADRYAEVAFVLQGQSRVLDVGSGSGFMLSVLSRLGHRCCGLDLVDPAKLAPTYARHGIDYRQCNVEVDNYPFQDAEFDAVTCCQVLEHFSHSPLPALFEMHRVLKKGGTIEIDVPNAACFRNRMRMLRGKHITWGYQEHYLHARPLLHKGLSFYPFRHNRELTKKELHDLLVEAGFDDVKVRFMKDQNFRTGFKKLLSYGSAFRNIVPSLRKTLIATGRKGEKRPQKAFSLFAGDAVESPWTWQK